MTKNHRSGWVCCWESHSQRESGIFKHTDDAGMIKRFFTLLQWVKAFHCVSCILFPCASCHLGILETFFLHSRIITSITKPIWCWIYFINSCLISLVTTISRCNYYAHFTAQIILRHIFLLRSWARSETVLKSLRKMHRCF